VTATKFPTAPAPVIVGDVARDMAFYGEATPEQWQHAVTGVGGDDRARWLLDLRRGRRWTPDALLVAHAFAGLLGLGPDPQTVHAPT
jgi:hypothetical protein